MCCQLPGERRISSGGGRWGEMGWAAPLTHSKLGRKYNHQRTDTRKGESSISVLNGDESTRGHWRWHLARDCYMYFRILPISLSLWWWLEKYRCPVNAEAGHAPWGRILGRKWYKSLKSFPPCYSQSPLLTDFTHPPPPLIKSSLKLVCRGGCFMLHSRE